jgi:hypothetical protein
VDLRRTGSPVIPNSKKKMMVCPGERKNSFFLSPGQTIIPGTSPTVIAGLARGTFPGSGRRP